MKKDNHPTKLSPLYQKIKHHMDFGATYLEASKLVNDQVVKPLYIHSQAKSPIIDSNSKDQKDHDLLQ